MGKDISDDNRNEAKSHVSAASRAIAEFLSALREWLKATQQRGTYAGYVVIYYTR